jgi:hypothetical protein
MLIAWQYIFTCMSFTKRKNSHDTVENVEYSQIQCQQLIETSGKIRRYKVLFRIMRGTDTCHTIYRTKRKKKHKGEVGDFQQIKYWPSNPEVRKGETRNAFKVSVGILQKKKHLADRGIDIRRNTTNVKIKPVVLTEFIWLEKGFDIRLLS